jgi:hypothetical protein
LTLLTSPVNIFDMRLLHAKSIRLRSFEENAIPPYSILSHTWEDEEVSFLDIQGPDAASKAGYTKIRYACQDALQRDLEYVWVDTCCIDKSSSAELSEAINSMFRWYANAAVCYAYLADVSAGLDWSESAFNSSRWWSRGWTLQELLAPADVLFFSRDGQLLGKKRQLSTRISDITGIGEGFITREIGLKEASIAKRMSWASRRKTTRPEDLAYCLLGIFGINMPLIYGEGNKAFGRLQEEIMKGSDDQSLFAWGYKRQEFPDHLDRKGYYGPFAPEPAAFRYSEGFIPDEIDVSTTAYAVTNKGLEISLRVIQLPRFWGLTLAVLACRPEKKLLRLVAIPIHFHGAPTDGSASFPRFPESAAIHFSDQAGFMRVGLSDCLLIKRDEAFHKPSRPLRFLTSVGDGFLDHEKPPKERSFMVRSLPENEKDLRILKVEPPEVWDPEQRIVRYREATRGHIVLRLWRDEGEGFAIVIPSPCDNPLLSSRHTSFRETRGRPLSYHSLAPANRPSWDLGCLGLKVIQGDHDIRTPNGMTIRTLDIEVVPTS